MYIFSYICKDSLCASTGQHRPVLHEYVANVTVCCRVLECVAVRCSALRCVAGHCGSRPGCDDHCLKYIERHFNVLSLPVSASFLLFLSLTFSRSLLILLTLSRTLSLSLALSLSLFRLFSFFLVTIPSQRRLQRPLPPVNI